MPDQHDPRYRNFLLHLRELREQTKSASPEYDEVLHSPSVLGPPPMQAGETVAAYQRRVRTQPKQVRLIDGLGFTKLVLVSPNATEYLVARDRDPMKGLGKMFFPNGSTIDFTEPYPAPEVFTYREDLKEFDANDPRVPVWRPRHILHNTHWSTWPRIRGPITMTKLDERMHQELDQWMRLDQDWSPRDEGADDE